MLVALVATGSSLTAQVTARPPVDTARADTAVPAAVIVRDTIKTPFAVSEVPLAAGATRVRWERDQIFQTGSLNVAELIARVPGAAIMR